MSQHGSSCVEDATASQLVLLVSMPGKERQTFTGFELKNYIMVGFCATQAQIKPKYMTT